MLTSIKKNIFFNLSDDILTKFLNIHPMYLFKIKKIDNNIYRLKYKNLQIHISRAQRLFKYKYGIENRLIEICDKYFINEISFIDNDIVIDCGSNIGELPMAIRVMTGRHLKIIAVEPDPIEFKVLKLNLFESDICFNYFLGNESKLSQVQFNNNTGDTHVITTNEKVQHLEGIKSALVHTLDDITLQMNLKSIKLLKIEVEGLEPEVLQGASKLLKITKYVSVDTGPENNTQYTFDDVHYLLVKSGFKLLKNNHNLSALFVKL